MKRKFSPGDLVEVRSKEEILATLDARAELKGLPFMPEMLQFCGKQFRVYKRAHKTCDTAINHGTSRWMGDAVLLDGMRCQGEHHGGCQAECTFFWWPEWLKSPEDASPSATPAHTGNPGCTEAALHAAAFAPESTPVDLTYSCQATRLPFASTDLAWWDLRQYIEDYTSGNTSAWTIIRGTIYVSIFHFSKLPFIHRVVEALYDTFQTLIGGIKFPRKRGIIPPGQKTPVGILGLQPGELVKVKSYEAILATLNLDNKNQGLYFDAELVPYCGKTHRVVKRISRIIDEKTGKMINMKNDSIMLENVNCQGRYSNNRMFCPRAMPCFWREIWLERTGEQPTQAPASPGVAITVDRQPVAPS